MIGGWSESEVQIERVVEKLVGCVITQINCLTSAFDLRVQFSNRYSLHLFCDRTLLDDLNNYSIRMPEGSFVINPRSGIKFEGSTLSEKVIV